MTYPPRSVIVTAAVALFACWFVYTRPLAALAVAVVVLVTVGVVGFVATVGWLVFGAGETGGGEVEEVTAAEWDDEADADRYAGGGW